MAASTSKKKRLAAALTLTLAAGGLLVLNACRSVPKERVANELLALSKNQPAREAGLKRRAATISLTGDEETVEFTYLHTRPQNPVDGRPAIVLIHGTPSSLFTWTDLVFGTGDFEGLAQDFEVYALDVIGHGVTASSAPPYSFQKCADYVSAFLDELELRDVVLVGQSYGGEFVWRSALDRPARVGRVVLMSSAGYARQPDQFLPEEKKMRSLPFARFGYALNSRERIAPALQLHFDEPLSDDQLDEIFWICENADNWRCMIELAKDEEGYRQDELRDLPQPTLLLWGAEDQAYTLANFGRRFEADIPGATMVVLDDTGHYPQEQNPAAVARELRRWLIR